MSVTRPALYGKLCAQYHELLLTSVRRGHWLKDYKAGPHPKTREKCLAAAKKYGLEPEDYKPFPDDGPGRGDYPDLEVISGEHKDPFYPYDNPELKRNFNEPMLADFDMFSEVRYNINFRHRVPLVVQVLQFLGCMAGCFITVFFCENFNWFLALSQKQYPAPGVDHYTFEPGPPPIKKIC